MRIGITYGTFDVLHYGHIRLLQNAKKICDYLIVGLSTDSFNEIKGKKSFLLYEERKQLLESLKYVDKIIPEDNWEQKKYDVEKHNVDVLIMGDDWTGSFQDCGCEVVYIPRTEIISSSKIKEVIFNV